MTTEHSNRVPATMEMPCEKTANLSIAARYDDFHVFTGRYSCHSGDSAMSFKSRGDSSRDRHSRLSRMDVSRQVHFHTPCKIKAPLDRRVYQRQLFKPHHHGVSSSANVRMSLNP